MYKTCNSHSPVPCSEVPENGLHDYSVETAEAVMRTVHQVNREARAAAAQAAAQILGGRGLIMGGPGYGFHAKPSKSYEELTSRISMYIRHGVWEDDDESNGA